MLFVSLLLLKPMKQHYQIHKLIKVTDALAVVV